MKGDLNTDVESIRISLQPHSDTIVRLVSTILGDNPLVLYTAVIALDVLLIAAYIYNMGLFAFLSLVLLISYVLVALYRRFSGVLQKFVFPESQEEKKPLFSFEDICNLIAKAQSTTSNLFEVLFEGKIGVGPIKIAIAAGIWFVVTVALNYIGNFWVAFIVINAILLAPSFIVKSKNNQAAKEPEANEEDKVKTE